MIRREILKEVLLDNRNEVVKHQVIPRSFQFEEFGNYVFVGIRRAGKSFLLYQRIQELLHSGHTWNEMLYVNFEDERLIGMTAADLNLILEVHAEMSTDRPMLFLDEIQNIDGWDKFVRRLADNKYRAYVTGSNAKMLSQDVATTLGGRYITVHVYPYDFKEFLYANGVEVTENSLFATESRAEIKRIFNDYFRSGGFPEGASLAAKRDYLTSVYQKIYLGDIAARHSIENTFALRILFRKLAESIKQPVSFTRITNIVASTGVKISKNTVINYMEYAKDACLLIPIQNIADKLVERETNPKYYFADPDLPCRYPSPDPPYDHRKKHLYDPDHGDNGGGGIPFPPLSGSQRPLLLPGNGGTAGHQLHFLSLLWTAFFRPCPQQAHCLLPAAVPVGVHLRPAVQSAGGLYL